MSNVASRNVESIPMSKKNRVAVAMAAIGLALTGRIASAQTLTVVRPSSHSESRALKDIDRGSSTVNGPTQIHTHHGQLPDEPEIPALTLDQLDPLVQVGPGPLIAATSGNDFDGAGANGYIPSDNNIAVGPNHIVETANVSYAIYTKTGVLLQSGSLKSLWTGLGGSCSANNGGDPVVQYDKLADRWIITQIGSLNAPYAQCIAVSTTGDPQGTYKLYSYAFGSVLNDYPKFGVWPTATNSAYLATYNLFNNGQSGAGAELCAYDRAAMIAGAASPVGLCFSNLPTYSYLPADVDGSTPPLDGTPGYFVNKSSSSLGVYKLTPNFAAATATLSARSTIPVAGYTEALDVPQPGTTMTLDALSDRLMYRLAFRMYADHEAMAVTHSVNNGGFAGARWYELRSPISTSGTFTIAQQGTFAPADGLHRWMGSIAMDSAGDMGLGYSVSGSALFPSIRYTGRTPTDAAGTMETEATLKDGFGSQTAYDRWGDYSSMRIDPSDDCTFWYVNEYLPSSGDFNWRTHIGSFKFNNCGGAPPPQDFSLSANPTSFTRVQGTSGGSTITVNPVNGFSGSTNLSIFNNSCPPSATCTFSTNPVAANGTSTLTVSTDASTPPRHVQRRRPGHVRGLTHTTTVAVTVTAAGGRLLDVDVALVAHGSAQEEGCGHRSARDRVGRDKRSRHAQRQRLALEGNCRLLAKPTVRAGQFDAHNQREPDNADRNVHAQRDWHERDVHSFRAVDADDSITGLRSQNTHLTPQMFYFNHLGSGLTQQSSHSYSAAEVLPSRQNWKKTRRSSAWFLTANGSDGWLRSPVQT